jgi:hypothetical protein
VTDDLLPGREVPPAHRQELVSPQEPWTFQPQGVDLVGDAELLVTGPFFPSADPLDQRPICEVPAGGVLDAHGRLLSQDRSMDQFLRGSLTFGNPPFELLTHFAGSAEFNAELATIATQAVGLPMSATLTGMLFPDGYGSVALRISVAGGWEAPCRGPLIEGFGPVGRDLVAGQLREALLPVLADMANRCCPNAAGDTLLPYFNLTYAGMTKHPRPGRATLTDHLRQLIYPRSPDPIRSDSTWLEEFFYAGYAFLLLASANPRHTLDQLEHLLQHLDVLYARMDRSASAADRLIRTATLGGEVEWLIAVERRLRADYQALVRPTFSYDHRVLKLRDSILLAWETDKAHARMDTLMEMARRAVERILAQEQAGRVARVNLVITILTILSFVASVEATVNLWSRLF